MLYILKGGPGCGKSSFMRKIAERLEDANIAIEYVLCSGDPDSLDAIIAPTLGIAYVDGTSPHVIEPKFPAVNATYINLGEFYDVPAISAKCDKIIHVTGEYKEHYKRAYALLSSFEKIPNPTPSPSAIISARRRAKGIIGREIKKRTGEGKRKVCFISAFCCKGHISEFDSVCTQCKRIYVLDNRFSLAEVMLNEFLNSLGGYDIIIGLSPLYPSTLSHIIIPELSLAFITSDPIFPYTGNTFRRLRLDTMFMRYATSQDKREIKFAEKIRTLLLDAAQNSLSLAKQKHDELEALYNSHVDFPSIYTFAESQARKHISQYILKQ